MCLVTLVPKGIDKYHSTILDGIRIAANTNTDGAGYSFKRNSTKKVYISKGYKNIEELIQNLYLHKLKPDDELMIHQRIGNKGAKNTEMCHPFVLSNDSDIILSNGKYVTFPTMVHNGTIVDHVVYNSNFSDTYNFVKDFMYNPHIISMLQDDIEFFKKTFKSKLGTNRLGFLFPDSNQEMLKIGEYKEVDGIFFSNESYKNKNLVNYGGVEFNNHHNSTCGYDYNDYWNKYDNFKESDFVETKPTNIGTKNYNYADEDINEISYRHKDAMKDENGIEFSYYLGMWIPNKFLTKYQFDSIIFHPCNNTVKDIEYVAKADDLDIGIDKGVVYEVISVNNNIKNNVHCDEIFVRKKYRSDGEIMLVPGYAIPQLFRMSIIQQPSNRKLRGYYNLICELNVSKNVVKRLNKHIESNKNSTMFKGVDYLVKDAIILFRTNLMKSLYPSYQNKQLKLLN